MIFSGGLPTDKAGRTHSITVLNGKSTTVLEMEHSVVDFVTLCESPHAAGMSFHVFFISDKLFENLTAYHHFLQYYLLYMFYFKRKGKT